MGLAFGHSRNGSHIITKKIEVKLKHWTALGIAIIVLLTSVLACSGGLDTESKVDLIESVDGLIQDVQAKSLLELQSLTLRDDNGEMLRFEANGKILSGFPPSHLREHMVLGLRVTVVFHREGDALILDDVTD